MTSHQFKRLTQISYGQLQRWSEAAILQPRMVKAAHNRGGPNRAFGLADAVRAGVTRELFRRGLRTFESRRLLKQIFTEKFTSKYVLGVHPARHILAVIRRRPRTACTADIYTTAAQALDSIVSDPRPTNLLALGEIVEDIRGRYRRTRSLSR